MLRCALFGSMFPPHEKLLPLRGRSAVGSPEKRFVAEVGTRLLSFRVDELRVPVMQQRVVTKFPSQG
jgi:hypothetical protein